MQVTKELLLIRGKAPFLLSILLASTQSHEQTWGQGTPDPSVECLASPCTTHGVLLRLFCTGVKLYSQNTKQNISLCWGKSPHLLSQDNIT